MIGGLDWGWNMFMKTDIYEYLKNAPPEEAKAYRAYLQADDPENYEDYLRWEECIIRAEKAEEEEKLKQKYDGQK